MAFMIYLMKLIVSLKKQTDDNYSFRLIDIKYSTSPHGTSNYGVTHCALVIYEVITMEEREKEVQRIAELLGTNTEYDSKEATDE